MIAADFSCIKVDYFPSIKLTQYCQCKLSSHSEKTAEYKQNELLASMNLS